MTPQPGSTPDPTPRDGSGGPIRHPENVRTPKPGRRPMREANAAAADGTPLDPEDVIDGLVDALTAILLHGEDPEFPCNAICDADCIDFMRNAAGCALAAIDRSPDAR